MSTTSGGDTASWGSGAMNALDAVMWRAQADPTLHSPVLAVERLDAAPDWDRLVGVFEGIVHAVPRLRERVAEAPLGLGVPRWGADPAFDLRFHLHRARLPDASGWAALLDASAQLAMRPFARDRPPWLAVLYEGLPGGGAALVLKMHHSVADGLGALALFATLHTTRSDQDADPAPAEVPPAGRGVATALAQQVWTDVAGLPTLVGRVASGALSGLGDPVGAVRSAARYGSSLRRVTRPPEAPPSPLLAGRGDRWRFATLDVSVRELRAAARTVGATTNDAYLAALLGGYRRYHAALGSPVRAIPMGVPISLRRRGDPQGGNRIASLRFSGPVDTADPAARIAEVRALVLAGKSEPAFDTVGLVAPVLARVPGAVTALLMGPITKGNDLQATLVPGGRDALYLAGAAVEAIYGFAPLPGCGAMVILLAHGDAGCVGINLDTAAITQPDLFLACVADGFGEVLDLR